MRGRFQLSFFFIFFSIFLLWIGEFVFVYKLLTGTVWLAGRHYELAIRHSYGATGILLGMHVQDEGEG